MPRKQPILSRAALPTANSSFPGSKPYPILEILRRDIASAQNRRNGLPAKAVRILKNARDTQSGGRFNDQAGVLVEQLHALNDAVLLNQKGVVHDLQHIR